MDLGSNSQAPSTVSPKDRLSCKLCQRRKVACDKGDPCSTCRRAGVKCEVAVRQRLPRGRNGGRKRTDAELKQRIGRLEALVTSLTSDSPTSGASPALMETQVPPIAQQPTPDTRPLSPEDIDAGRDMTRYLGSSCWAYICDEVHCLIRAKCMRLSAIMPDPNDVTGKWPPRCIGRIFG